MRALIADRVERSMNAVLSKGSGSIAMLLGMVITMLVQSSSITTSILIPMSAAGVLCIRNAYPVTLGANVGTTITALLAALASSSPDALTVALVHTLFNITGILVLYVPRSCAAPRSTVRSGWPALRRHDRCGPLRMSWGRSSSFRWLGSVLPAERGRAGDERGERTW